MSFEEFWTRGDIHERVNTALKDAKLLDKKIEIRKKFYFSAAASTGLILFSLNLISRSKLTPDLSKTFC